MHDEANYIGGSIFLIALGAILAYAVTASVAGIDLNTIGAILMIAGGIWLALGLIFMVLRNNRHDETDVVHRHRDGSISEERVTHSSRI